MNVIDFVYPKKCFECGRNGSYLCNECLARVAKPRLFCLHCQKPSIDGATHIKCKKRLSIDFAYSPWKYEGVIRRAMLKLKYNFAYDIADELSVKFIRRLKSDVLILPQNAIITPIPLHPLRFNWRGFNQSEDLAKKIAKKFSWQFYPDILIRKISTRPQTEVKGKERKVNVSGVFALNPNYSLTLINAPIVVFDDVLTTGSTLKEAAKVLKRNGVKEV